MTGCAHNGIVNILEYFRGIRRRMPDYVIGGFHLTGISPDGNKNLEEIDKIGGYLLDTGTKYYTCHCTGIEAYNTLKAITGDRIEYLSAGSEITI